MKIVLSTWNNLSNQALGVHSIAQQMKIILKI
jgi:hypothetical protein